MNKTYLACFFLGSTLPFVGFIHGKKILQQAQTIHREIGKNLVQIRRESPTFQPKIYTLLDLSGQLYKLLNISQQKKTKIKLAMYEEKQFRLSLENDNEKLKTEMDKLKQNLKEENSKLSESHHQAELLKKERGELLKKQDLKEKEYLTRVKELENSLSKIEKNDPIPFENETTNISKTNKENNINKSFSKNHPLQ